MEVKNKVYQFNKMMKDIIPDKIPDGVYYNAKNIRFISGDKEIISGFHFEMGNKLSLSLPRPSFNYDKKIIKYTINIYNEEGILTGTQEKTLKYVVEEEITDPYGLPRNEIERTYYAGTPQTYYISQKQIIIGYVETRKGVVLFSTDNGKFDCIWYLTVDKNNIEEYDIELLYMRDMGFSTENPIEAINNYETEKIDKIYWVDTIHQLRHLNLEQSIENGDNEELIDVEVSLLDGISTIKLSQPQLIDVVHGGSHTSGMIQYGYSLYKMNGSQTTLSPLSELIPLGKNERSGGDVNEIVGASPIMEINNIDTKYDNIIVYAIKYTSLNTTPQVSVIEDRSIPSSGSLRIYDNGNIIRNSTLEELQLVNNSLNFPGTITSKDNYLFYSDFKDNDFRVNLDVRAYQFPANPQQSALVYDDIKEVNNNIIGNVRNINSAGLNTYTDDPEDTFDSINLDYDYYKYQGDRTTLGGEGKYVKFKLANIYRNEKGRGRFFKDNEIYRIGIKFYNEYGQETEPMWVCDFKTPQGNLEGRFNILEFQLKPEFNTWLNANTFTSYTKPVGYKVLVAQRTNNDKTILASGLVSPMMFSGLKSIIEPVSDVSLTEIDNTFPPENPNFNETTKSITKMPSPLLRNAWLDRTPNKMGMNEPYFQYLDSPMQRARHNSALFWSNWNLSPTFQNHNTTFSFIYESPVSMHNSLEKYLSYQYTKMMQLYTPEAIFGTLPSMTTGCTLEVRYGVLNNKNGVWMRLINVHLNTVLVEFSVENILSPLIPHGTNNTYSVEWLIGGGDNAGFDYVNSQGGNTTHGRYVPAFNKAVSESWNSKGMFSNWNADSIGENQHFTALQMFYRKYGDSLDYINSGDVENIIQTPGLPTLNSPLNGVKINTGQSGGTISFNKEDLNPNATKVVNILQIDFTSNAPENIQRTISLTFDGITQEEHIKTTPDNISIQSEKPLNPTTTSSNYSMNIVEPTNTPAVLNLTLNLITKILDDNDNILDSFNITNSITTVTKNLIETQGPISGELSVKHTLLKPGKKNSNYNTSHIIYDKPIYSQTGSSIVNYAGNSNFRFSNNLYNYMNDELGGTNNQADKSIRKMNTMGVDAVTFVLNPNAEQDYTSATAYEDVVDAAQFLASSNTRNGGSIYCDIVKSKREIYFGGIYGGNSYEDKKRTIYLEVGDYYNTTTNNNKILNPGDTFVQDFKFLRMIRGPQTTLDTTVIEHEEIVEYLTETTIDLYNRNDDSVLDWSANFSYSEEEYMKYNKVYSQNNIVNASRGLDYNFKRVDNFGSTIRASRLKTPGELYDSWLQTLVNESLDLDGKYGKVTKLINFNDNVFATQEKAISLISINPRVQVSTSDGSAVQLGTGGILDGYVYVSTTSGSLKWSSIVTTGGIFYVDSRNKTFNRVGENVEEISRNKGFSKFFKDNIIHEDVLRDNVILNEGISLGYDRLKTDIYITYKTSETSWTLSYNLLQDSFSSFYDYNSNFYIPVNDKLISINPNTGLEDQLYTMYKGKPTTFYDKQEGAEITFIVNPEHLTECTFHNLEYVDRSYIDDIENNYTFNSIEVTNEFQNSGIINLTPRINLRKLNRKWRTSLPRHNNKVSRIRNNWSKITLRNDNIENSNHELNDFVLYYTPNYKKLQ